MALPKPIIVATAFFAVACGTAEPPAEEPQPWEAEEVNINRPIGPDFDTEFVAVSRSAELYVHPVAGSWAHGGDGFWVMEVIHDNGDWLRVRYDVEFAECDDSFPGLDGLDATFYVRPDQVHTSAEAEQCVAGATRAEWPTSRDFEDKDTSDNELLLEPLIIFGLRAGGVVWNISGVLREPHRFEGEPQLGATGHRCFALTENDDGDVLEACFPQNILDEYSSHGEDDDGQREQAPQYAVDNGEWGTEVLELLRQSDAFDTCADTSTGDGDAFTSLVIGVDEEGRSVDGFYARTEERDEDFAQCVEGAIFEMSLPPHPRGEAAWFSGSISCNGEQECRVAHFWPRSDAAYGAIPASHPLDVLYSHRTDLKLCASHHIPPDFEDLQLQAFQFIVAPDGEVLTTTFENRHPDLEPYYDCVRDITMDMQLAPVTGGGIIRIRSALDILAR